VRAGTLDIVVETGAQWSRQIGVFKPATPIPIGTVTPGQRVFVDNAPLLVHAVATAPGGRVHVTFGHGLYNDPTMVFSAGALIAPAVSVVVRQVSAAYTIVSMDPDTGTETLTAVEIGATIAPDGLSFTLAMDADTTAAMADLPAALSWDCFTLTDEWSWQRTLEGTLSTIRGDAR